MLLKNLVLLLVVLATAVYCKPKKSSESEKTLTWPVKYYFEISKYIIQAGLTEDVKVWKTNKESRIEYNNGAVKTFVTKPKHKRSKGYLYEIHPETYGLDKQNEMKCNKIKQGKWSSGPEDILPDTDDFNDVGKEQMGSQECTKFEREIKEEGNNRQTTKETVWAYYQEQAKTFVPVRYELKKFNNWIGNVDQHDIWDFDNFGDQFNEKEIFNATKYCPEENEINLKEADDEAVTKHLMFINPENKHHVDHVFTAFKNNFNRNYAHKDEHSMRRSIFQRNLRLIKTTNRKNLGYTLAVNKFSDRTPEETKRHMGLMRRPAGEKGLAFPYDSETLSTTTQKLPQEYDLRLEGVVSPVQNQMECGSCWTFGTTSAIEGAIARSQGQLIRLSNQALIDCAWEFGASGCGGGSDTAVYKWVMKYGIPKLSDYGTYADREGYCKIANMTSTYKITNFVDVTPNSISALKVALIENGPLSVSIDATDTFIQYSGGVFYDMTCDNELGSLNHEVSLIGYGEQYGETFWILKNSWGQDWGIDGFMHIAAKDNNCGIMTEPTYVMV